MDPDQHPSPAADGAQSRDGTAGCPAPGNLADIVDGLEERIITERRADGVAGNADERAQVTAVDSEDKAPD